MKNITKQYQDLLEGKMSKDNFIRNARMTFPQYISSVTSIDDAIKILKGKRIIGEIADFRPTPVFDSTSDPVKQGYEDNKDGYELEDCPFRPGTEEMALWRDGWLDYESEKQMAHDEETFRRETGDAEYELPVRESLNEAEKPEGNWKKSTGKDEYGRFKDIDSVNYTTFLRAVAYEVGKQDDMSDEMLPAILEKVAKKMKKDPNAYRELVISNYADIAKQDEALKMVQVNGKNHTDDDNAMEKIKGQETLKADPHKNEDRKGKPAGVKEMGITPKKAKGITSVMDMPGKEKILDDLKESLKKRIVEDTHYKYTQGMKVQTPEGSGEVIDIKGGTLTIKLRSGDIKDFQVNTIDHFGKKAAEPVYVTPDNEPPYDPEIPGRGLTEKKVEEEFRPGVNLGGSFDKFKMDMSAEEQFHDMMKNYDWYYEMSDDPRVYDRGISTDYKLKDLAKKIGPQKAIDIFNQYAPEDRKATERFFIEKKDKYSKLKEFLKKAIKKEAVKYKVGGETIFKADSDAKSFEDDLTKARLKFTKTKISS